MIKSRKKMTVAELIHALSTLPQDTEIYTYNTHTENYVEFTNFVFSYMHIPTRYDGDLEGIVRNIMNRPDFYGTEEDIRKNIKKVVIL